MRGYVTVQRTFWDRHCVCTVCSRQGHVITDHFSAAGHKYPQSCNPGYNYPHSCNACLYAAHLYLQIKLQ